MRCNRNTLYYNYNKKGHKIIFNDLQLYEHQKVAINHLKLGARAVFLPYGSGKSKICVLHLFQSENDRLIIFCKQNATLSWKKELTTIFKKNTVTYYIHDKKSLKLELEQYDEPSIHLIPSYLIRHRYNEIIKLCQTFRINKCIFDESTTIKNPNAKITQMAVQLKYICGKDGRLVATGEPTPEHPKELWSQFEFAYDVNPLGRTYYQFMSRFFIKDDYGYILKYDKRAEYNYLKNSLSASTYDPEVLQKITALDRAVYTIEIFEQSKEQKKLIKSLYDDWYLDGQGDLNYEIQLYTKSLQIQSGFYYVTDSETDIRSTIRLKDNPKLDLMSEIIIQLLEENKKSRIVVWYSFKEEISILTTVYPNAYVYKDAQTLRQYTSDVQANLIFIPIYCSESFNDLVICDTMIFYSNSPSMEKRNQAEARLLRLGQNNKRVNIIDLCSQNTNDYKVVKSLQQKSFNPHIIKNIHESLRTPIKSIQSETKTNT